MRCSMDAAYLRERLHYDPRTNVFTWRDNPRIYSWWNSTYVGTVAGNSVGQIRIDGKRYYANRLAYLYITGTWPMGKVTRGELERLRDHGNYNQQAGT